uniref:Uncharacterized protein n=1 Tax=viral metagenome TaxID=1070528 RepID=A0A6M3LNJ1_9ZZZZ
MDIVTFNIDFDEKCKQCGKGGAVNGGICLKCLNKNIKSGKYNKILNRRDKMKKNSLKSAFLFMFITGLFSFLPNVKAQVYRWPEMITIQLECHICGKTIQEQKEKKSNMFLGDMYFLPNYSCFTIDSLRAQYLIIHKQIYICKDCLYKYGTEIETKINKFWDKLILEAIDNNKKKRKYYDEKRELDKINEINSKIENLKKERDKLIGKESE